MKLRPVGTELVHIGQREKHEANSRLSQFWQMRLKPPPTHTHTVYSRFV